jgi:2-C-methyl-D-erythritol 4-phosphate cytidylyltransferase/2-C-methyl-D-erythritol 2,4-cyclodiphosphate synthase
MLTRTLIERTITALADGADAVVPVLPVTDTLKFKSGQDVRTLDRTNLFRSQTPQGFEVSRLGATLAEAARGGFHATDEATLIERDGGKVVLIEGDERNLKLTVPADRAILEALMSASQFSRSGIGYDVHRLVPDRDLVLGGVRIPHDRGLEGHSDADVVLHALCDALLGACALGDIGHHFPPGDEQFRGISSLELLRRVSALLDANGFEIGNMDVMVIAESPKIGPYREAMIAAIAEASGVSPSSLSIKATTNEGLGFAGRQEGIAALATATVFGRA